jgi:hypothetical protein
MGKHCCRCIPNSGIPFNVLLDPTGKIVAKELRGEALGATLATLLK